jgi:hypothetical protein
MQRGNPQLSALALLVQRFGKPIQGGYEVHVSALEMREMSPYGIFQEVPDIDGTGVRWQYFPNRILDIEGHTVPDEPEKILLPADEKKDG